VLTFVFNNIKKTEIKLPHHDGKSSAAQGTLTGGGGEAQGGGGNPTLVNPEASAYGPDAMQSMDYWDIMWRNIARKDLKRKSQLEKYQRASTDSDSQTDRNFFDQEFFSFYLSSYFINGYSLIPGFPLHNQQIMVLYSEIQLEMFLVIWGPFIASLSVFLDQLKAEDLSFVPKSEESVTLDFSRSVSGYRYMEGFMVCAEIAAHYYLCDVLDNLISSLFKFSALSSSPSGNSREVVIFGNNLKGQCAVEYLFKIAHTYGNFLRDSWKNIVSSMLALHRMDLLGFVFLELEKLCLEKSLKFQAEEGIFEDLQKLAIPVLPESKDTNKNKKPVSSSIFRGLSLLDNWWGSSSTTPKDQVQETPEDVADSSESEDDEPDDTKPIIIEDKTIDARLKLFSLKCKLPELFLATQDLSKESLEQLFRAIGFHILSWLNTVSSNPHFWSQKKFSLQRNLLEKNVIFSMEILKKILLVNSRRFTKLSSIFWSYYADSFLIGIMEICAAVDPQLPSSQKVLALNVPLNLIDKSLTVVFSLTGTLLKEEFEQNWTARFAREYLTETLSKLSIVLSKFRQNVHHLLARKLVFGLGQLFQLYPDLLLEHECRKCFCTILHQSASHFVCEPLALGIVRTVLDHSHNVPYLCKTKAAFMGWMDTILAFVNCQFVNNPNLTVPKVFELLTSLYSLVSFENLKTLLPVQFSMELSTKDPSVSDEIFWNHVIFENFVVNLLEKSATLCSDPRSEIRNLALAFLQKSSLSNFMLQASRDSWLLCFEKVFFPLMFKLLELKSTVKSEMAAIEESRSRAFALVSRIFLQYLNKLILLPNFLQLWVYLLEYTKLYMKADSEVMVGNFVESSKLFLGGSS
jgi:hypothetical protein